MEVHFKKIVFLLLLPWHICSLERRISLEIFPIIGHILTNTNTEQLNTIYEYVQKPNLHQPGQTKPIKHISSNKQSYITAGIYMYFKAFSMPEHKDQALKEARNFLDNGLYPYSYSLSIPMSEGPIAFLAAIEKACGPEHNINTIVHTSIIMSSYTYLTNIINILYSYCF